MTTRPQTTVTGEELCALFRDRAAATHELITYSYSAGIGVGEESITDGLLVEIRRRLPTSHVHTRKFNKHEESSLSGADWLWAIGRPGRWISLLVQAKLARPKASRLNGLHHGKPAGSQRVKLLNYARMEKLLPLYVVYSGFSGTLAAVPPPRNTRARKAVAVWTPPCRGAEVDMTQMGCVVVRPRHVALMQRGKAPKDGVIALLNRGRPWSCLFCCHGTGQTELADIVLAGIRGLPIDTPAPTSPGGSATPEPDDDFALISDRLITRDPPTAVAAILRGRDLDETPPVSAITIISSEPLDVPTRQLDHPQFEPPREG